jgi:hypothetical protein
MVDKVVKRQKILNLSDINFFWSCLSSGFVSVAVAVAEIVVVAVV